MSSRHVSLGREPAAVPVYRRGNIRTPAPAQPMFREPASSTMIAAIGYDEETETLEVEFVSGSVCRYRCVSLDLYDDFRASPSKGKFFNRCIRDAYPWERVK
jgi:KTSC domain-containing protein